MSSSVGMIIPNIYIYMESHKIPWFQTTNQLTMIISPINKT